MKKIKMCIVLLGFSILVLLTSCTKIIKTELIDVDVIIDEVYHKDSYYDYVYVGNRKEYYYGAFGDYERRYNPEINRIKVKYENVYETIESKALYEKYKNCVGQTIKGTLKIDIFNNGDVSKTIIINGEQQWITSDGHESKI